MHYLKLYELSLKNIVCFIIIVRDWIIELIFRRELPGTNIPDKFSVILGLWLLLTVNVI